MLFMVLISIPLSEYKSFNYQIYMVLLIYKLPTQAKSLKQHPLAEEIDASFLLQHYVQQVDDKSGLQYRVQSLQEDI